MEPSPFAGVRRRRQFPNCTTSPRPAAELRRAEASWHSRTSSSRSSTRTGSDRGLPSGRSPSAQMARMTSTRTAKPRTSSHAQNGRPARTVSPPRGHGCSAGTGDGERSRRRWHWHGSSRRPAASQPRLAAHQTDRDGIASASVTIRSAARLRNMRAVAGTWPDRPLVSILMPTYEPNARYLRAAIELGRGAGVRALGAVRRRRRVARRHGGEDVATFGAIRASGSSHRPSTGHRGVARSRGDGDR